MIKKITQYGSVGALGTLTNLVVFTFLSMFSIGHNLASLVAFIVAVSQNYRLNKEWTFKSHNSQSQQKFFKYMSLNFFSFIINLFVLNIVVSSFGSAHSVQIMGQALGIATAMAFNFLGAYFLVFSKNRGVHYE